MNDPSLGGPAGRPFRQRFRDRSHASAHAAHTETESAPPEHLAVARGKVDLIIDETALAEYLDHVRSVGTFAYDSEFIGELSYFPKLCLLQLATTQRVALVDPLAQLDLTPLWAAISDPAIRKIVHAGQQDLEPVHRLTNKRASNVFDTQIAGGFIGLSYPAALSRLVRELLGVRLGKGFTFTHWDQRPLTHVQLRYAADDVRYLPALTAELDKQLAALGHTDWANLESKALCDPATYDFDKEKDYLKLRGAGGLQAANLAVLRELAAWRNDSAKSHDVPPRSYLRDEILIDMARAPARDLKDLAKIKGLPRPVEEKEGARLVSLMQSAISLPPEQQPIAKSSEESLADHFQVDALWAAVQSYCMGRSIDSAVITSRAEVAGFYRDFLDQKSQSHRLMNGWRLQALGDWLNNFLHGKSQSTLTWHDGLRLQKNA